jgi:integrase
MKSAHAKRTGFYDGANPVQGTAIPPSPKGGDTYAYSLEEISAMLGVLPEPSKSIVATAAYTGARRGKIQALRWEDFHDGAIYIDRSMWESHVSAPKTRASKAPVPIISSLAAILELHRFTLGNPTSGPMFPSANRHPLNLNNILNRQIKPTLDRCAACKKSKTDHAADHPFRRGTSLPTWHGWHGFRRGLATNLNRLGIQDKTIQAILRHATLGVTQNLYIKAVNADSVTAMQSLESSVESVLCAKRAPGGAISPSRAVN